NIDKPPSQQIREVYRLLFSRLKTSTTPQYSRPKIPPAFLNGTTLQRDRSTKKETTELNTQLQ
ncbi:MAG: hypothetical protein QXY50_04735, partial [Candidatus Caldarchaeum sp.]